MWSAKTPSSQPRARKRLLARLRRCSVTRTSSSQLRHGAGPNRNKPVRHHSDCMSRQGFREVADATDGGRFGPPQHQTASLRVKTEMNTKSAPGEPATELSDVNRNKSVLQISLFTGKFLYAGGGNWSPPGGHIRSAHELQKRQQNRRLSRDRWSLPAAAALDRELQIPTAYSEIADYTEGLVTA